MTTETFQVRDGARVVTFDGVKLGEISSRRPTSPRWTDMILYRTATDKYVLSKIGRTTVLHQPGCPSVYSRLKRFVDEHPGVEPDEAEWELHTCIPDEYDLNEILVEQTRYWAVIADHARDVIQNLYRNQDGVKFLPRMAVNLLEDAALRDKDLADAFYVEKVT